MDAQGADAANGEGGAPTVTGLAIVTISGEPLQAAAGDAISLKVVSTLSDGTTADLPPDAQVRWTAPRTIVAQDPNDAGAVSVLPEAGAQPTGFFVENPYRPDRSDYAGTLFVIDPGTAGNGAVLVAASVGDGGTASASIPVSPTPAGSPDAGAALYHTAINCAICHGKTGGGSPPVIEPDGGTVYILMGGKFPYPAPPLYNTSAGGAPTLAADPSWNAALFGFATLADMDNMGVALRHPMPDLCQNTLAGKPVGAQTFADIYAYMKTQTQ